MPDESLQYPIGKFAPKATYTAAELNQLIGVIEQTPARIEETFRKLTATQLEAPYRPGGWTARQVIHHVADSHMNAYIRFKWALTEDSPTIKAYNEKAWAETAEVRQDPSLSISVLKALHAKWVTLLRSLSATDLQKSFTHPETGKAVPLDRLIALYAWHGEHHLGHLKLILNSSQPG